MRRRKQPETELKKAARIRRINEQIEEVLRGIQKPVDAPEDPPDGA